MKTACVTHRIIIPPILLEGASLFRFYPIQLYAVGILLMSKHV